MKKKIFLGIATLIAGATMSAAALGATATTTVNVRSGPGTNYNVVGVLNRGDHVDVNGCQNGWCQIDKHGPDGWVSSRYLDGVGGGHPAPAPKGNPAPGPKDNQASVSISIGKDGVNFMVGDDGVRREYKPAHDYHDHCIRRDGQVYCPVN